MLQTIGWGFSSCIYSSFSIQDNGSRGQGIILACFKVGKASQLVCTAWHMFTLEFVPPCFGFKSIQTKVMSWIVRASTIAKGTIWPAGCGFAINSD